jgi:hypothetical protein
MTHFEDDKKAFDYLKSLTSVRPGEELGLYNVAVYLQQRLSVTLNQLALYQAAKDHFRQEYQDLRLPIEAQAAGVFRSTEMVEDLVERAIFVKETLRQLCLTLESANLTSTVWGKEGDSDCGVSDEVLADEEEEDEDDEQYW